MKIKTFIISAITLFISLYLIIGYHSLKHIDKNRIDVSKYITLVDEVSENKVQVNWKYVVSIIAVENKNKIKNISDDKIKNTANLFIEKSDNGYKLNSLDNVLNKLNFTDKEKERVNDYIDQLKYFGLTPYRLKEDSKYTKFIEEIKDEAIKNYKEYKILPSITIAQAILESSWGESDLAQIYNNLFGIKADSSWKGEYVTLETFEFYDTKIEDKFRVYSNKNQSIKDHAKFLVDNQRYKKYGVFEAKTYIEQAYALQNAGYSTAEDNSGQKRYAKDLIEIIRQYNLQLIDSEIKISD
ncbi:glycoside hydrolase family 73 protein [Romboutsia timonensis]|uniref:glycoside hydrolase family 73 protein n=1 Tax=Romboutsia timonensis TaxID=1776391 RepID=UPI0008DA11D3|nr:glucosaminidase domain-containing protein [Romboutsia timonensis]